MALTASQTLNIPGTTQQIIFSNPSEIENITYSTSGITYASEISSVLSRSDFALFFQYKIQFFNSLFVDFPNIVASYQLEVPVCKVQIYSSNGPNLIQFLQTSTASPISSVYNITYDRGTHTATFSSRINPITITLQEYFLAFQVLSQFAKQVSLA